MLGRLVIGQQITEHRVERLIAKIRGALRQKSHRAMRLSSEEPRRRFTQTGQRGIAIGEVSARCDGSSC